jgi:AcrR family transcriptional regulator
MRRYHSPRRQQQAEGTRRAILEAAERLFEDHGYATTTMAAIAEEAGVALKTVYVAFETKRGLLRDLWHLRLRGDESDVPMGERPWYREVLDESDPERQVLLIAANSRAVKSRAAGLMKAIREAASVDSEAASLWSRIQSDFRAIQRPIVEGLHRRGALRAELDVDRATDILWALNHPDLWHLLVGERDWSAEEYERWFADAVRTQLLRPT